MNYKIVNLNDFFINLKKIKQDIEFLYKEISDKVLDVLNIKYSFSDSIVKTTLLGQEINDEYIYLPSVEIMYSKYYNKIISATDVNVEEDDVILISYYQNLFNYLDSFFINFSVKSKSVFWKYEEGVFNSEFEDYDIPSLFYVKNNYLKSEYQTISSIVINNPKLMVPTKINSDISLNRIENNDVITYINSIKIDDEYLFIDNSFSVLNVDKVETNILDVVNNNNKLLNKDNVNVFLKKDLTNIDFLEISDEIIDFDSVLSSTKVASLMSEYKNNDDLTVTSKNTLTSSLNPTYVVNKEVLSFVIKKELFSILEEIIYSSLDNDSLSSIDSYYASKIKEYQTNYVLSNNYNLTGVSVYNNSCMEINNPLTVEDKNMYCLGASIDNSSKIILKGEYKHWLKQVVESGIVR